MRSVMANSFFVATEGEALSCSCVSEEQAQMLE
jgi:hypothetical protein